MKKLTENIVVVICLQFCIFKGFFSTNFGDSAFVDMLWFAYNFVFLKGSFQQVQRGNAAGDGCDLLTILYF